MIDIFHLLIVLEVTLSSQSIFLKNDDDLFVDFFVVPAIAPSSGLYPVDSIQPIRRRSRKCHISLARLIRLLAIFLETVFCSGPGGCSLINLIGIATLVIAR